MFLLVTGFGVGICADRPDAPRPGRVKRFGARDACVMTEAVGPRPGALMRNRASSRPVPHRLGSAHFLVNDDATTAEHGRVMPWVVRRIGDRGRDAIWHVTALREIPRRLAEQGVTVTTSVEWGQRVPEEEITAYEVIRRHRVPLPLRQVWRQVGTVSWRSGRRGMRLLSPAQLLERRDIAERYTRGCFMPPHGSIDTRIRFGALDVIAETVQGVPVTLVNDAAPAGGPHFCAARRGMRRFDWMPLAQALSTGLLAGYVASLSRVVRLCGRHRRHVHVYDLPQVPVGVGETAAVHPAFAHRRLGGRPSRLHCGVDDPVDVLTAVG